MDKKSNQIIVLVIICLIPLLFGTACGITDTLLCTSCGDNENRLIFCASGVDKYKNEYYSCVGPAGIVGFGLDTACWPTECIAVKNTNGSYRMTGCVKYYNKIGFIDKSSAMSYGEYNLDATCLGTSCFGTNYIESRTDSSKIASSQFSCLGVNCGEKQQIDYKGLDQKISRHFMNGCYSCTEDE